MTELDQIEETLGAFCKSKLPIDDLRRCDDEHRFPAEAMAALAADGWAGTTVPEAWGGSGAANEELAAIHIAVARHSLVVAQAFYSLWLLGADLIARLGSPTQQQKWLPRIAAGEARIAFALTEPDSGSDAAAARTVARPIDDGFLLSGQKVFITGAAVADAVVVTARTDAEPRRQDGLSLVLVDPKAAGVTIRPIKKIGLHALDLCEVFLDDVRVPADAIIGERGKGWAHLRGGLAKERTILAAICTGALYDLIDHCAAYACQRQAFGQPIGRFQMVAEKIVDMKVAANAARALTMEAAKGLDEATVIDASIAKLFASEAYVGATRQAVQVFGGYGFTEDYAVGRHYRDAKYLEIGGDSSEIQRLIIGRSMGLM